MRVHIPNGRGITWVRNILKRSPAQAGSLVSNPFGPNETIVFRLMTKTAFHAENPHFDGTGKFDKQEQKYRQPETGRNMSLWKNMRITSPVQI
jgi:hypothetical protein